MEGIHIILSAEKIGEWHGIPITNTLLTSWVVVAMLIVISVLVGRKLRLIPGRVQFLFEALVGVMLSYIEEILESRDLARRFFPLLATLFLFIFLANLIEFIPGIGSIGFFHSSPEGRSFVPLFRSVNTDMNMTFALAIVSVVVIEVTGVAVIGFFKYTKQFLNFSSPINFFVGMMELLSKVSRFIAFGFRLFGNIFSGEVMIMVVSALVLPILIPVPLMLFEVFIGFIQAAIFSLLTLFFIKLAVTEPQH